MCIFGTKDVARMLGISISKLQRALWDERLSPQPAKGPGGAFIWTPDDVERASWQLLGRPYEPREVNCNDTNRRG